MPPLDTPPLFRYTCPMKRIAVLFLPLLLALASAAAHTGLGVQGGLSLRSSLPDSDEFTFRDGAVRPYLAAGLSAASSRSPWVFALQLRTKPWYVGVTADNWFVYKSFGRDCAWYLFWGISGGAELEGAFGVDTGARAGAGANVFLARRRLELYAQAAWNPSFGVYLKGGGDVLFVRPLSFPLDAGLRVWW